MSRKITKEEIRIEAEKIVNKVAKEFNPHCLHVRVYVEDLKKKKERDE